MTMSLSRNPIFVINGCMILQGGNGPVSIVGRYKKKVTGHRSQLRLEYRTPCYYTVNKQH